MSKIFLIGFMGSGKSTIGRKLSIKQKNSFMDTDDYIEKKEKKKIKEIFEMYGESYFRHLETQALHSIDATIIATGGGIIEREENIQIMKERGMILFLDVPFAEINRRLQGDKTRPLWNEDKTKAEKLYEKRYPIYMNASDYVIKTNGKTVDDIVDEIISWKKS